MEKSQHSNGYHRLLLELKLARVRAGLSQAAAAEKLCAYKTYVSKIEQGERKVDVVELADLCKAYGLTVSQMLKSAGIE